MGLIPTLAVSAMGPVLGLAMCAARRRATTADDARRLAALVEGRDESAWLAAVCDQVPLGTVDPGLAERLGGLGLLDECLVEQARSLAGVWRMRPGACQRRWLAVTCCAAMTFAAGLATGSLAACASCAALTSLATLDLWWRRVDGPACVAVAAMCVAAPGGSPAVAVAAALTLAGGLLAYHVAGRAAIGDGDAWLAGALAAVLARCGLATVAPAMLVLLAELLCARAALGRHAMVPMAPLFVAPAAAAMALGW